MEMFEEQARSASTELVLWEEPERQKVKRRLGKHALKFPDGFVALDPVESQFAGMRKELEARIIDQPGAIHAMVEALERSNMRLPNDNHPIANFAFLGPTGVGKSEAARVLSQLLGDGSVNLIKIDCSNFSNGHEITALLGSPPSYIGNDIVPVLNKNAVEKPGTVILFDEVEKGSPKLYNLMLQIMDDGELRLNNGKTVYFRNAVIILTSNLGAREMATQQSKTGFGFSEEIKTTDRQVLENTALKSFKQYPQFTPEFINRLDKMVVFHQLTPEGLGRILDLIVANGTTHYEKQLGMRLSLSDATKAFLISLALKEPHNGARPLERAYNEHILTGLGRFVGNEGVEEGTEVRVFHISEAPKKYQRTDDSELIFTTKADPTLEKESTIKTRARAARKALLPVPEPLDDEEYDPDFSGPPNYN